MFKRRNERIITMFLILSFIALLIILNSQSINSLPYSENLNQNNYDRNDDIIRATHSNRNLQLSGDLYYSTTVSKPTNYIQTFNEAKQPLNYRHISHQNHLPSMKQLPNVVKQPSNVRQQQQQHVTNVKRTTGNQQSNNYQQRVNQISVNPKVLKQMERQEHVYSSPAAYTMDLTPSRPQNVSRHKSPHYPWGNHAFGPLENYLVTLEGTKWKAYFHQEAVAVILEDQEDRVLNCTLLEIIPDHEQKVALVTLGKVMPLVPLSLPQMVKLNSYCSTSPFLLPPPALSTPLPIFTNTNSPDNFLLHASSALMGILPGTKWCGLRDRAHVYHQLGERSELDRCCRSHDHCPLKLRGGKTRYGARNEGFTTLSHCSCDEAFFNCLKSAVRYDDMANVVGNIFFNLAGPHCLATIDTNNGNSSPALYPNEGRASGPSSPDSSNKALLCITTDEHNECRHWVKGVNFKETRLEVIDANFQFR